MYVCTRPLCILEQAPQHRRKQALETTKLSHPSHDVWRWRTTMYVKSVNLVFLVLMHLLLSLPQPSFPQLPSQWPLWQSSAGLGAAETDALSVFFYEQ